MGDAATEEAISARGGGGGIRYGHLSWRRACSPFIQKAKTKKTENRVSCACVAWQDERGWRQCRGAPEAALHHHHHHVQNAAKEEEGRG